MADEAEIDEPFELTIRALQGRWLCESLNSYLQVSNRTVSYDSGESYRIEQTPDGKFEVLGFVAKEGECDASTIVWKNKATGERLEWTFEGTGSEDHDADPEVDASNIIEGGRRGRNRKPVDYQALDRTLDREGGSSGGASGGDKKSVWQIEYEAMRGSASKKRAIPSATSSGVSGSAIDGHVKVLTAQLREWVVQMLPERAATILEKRGRVTATLSLDTDLSKGARDVFANRMRALGASVIDGKGSEVIVRVPESAWPALRRAFLPQEAKRARTAADPLEVVTEAMRVLTDASSSSARVDEALASLEGVAMTVDLLRLSRAGVALNKFAKTTNQHGAAKAGALVEAWKNTYRQQTTEGGPPPA